MFLIAVTFTAININCHRNVLPHNYSTKPNVSFSIYSNKNRFGNDISLTSNKQRFAKKSTSKILKEQNSLMPKTSLNKPRNTSLFGLLHHFRKNRTNSIDRKQSVNLKQPNEIIKAQRSIYNGNYVTKPKVGFSFAKSEYRLKTKRLSCMFVADSTDAAFRREVIKEQKTFRKEHINKQTEDVKERMKESKLESDKLNSRGKTRIERLIVLINNYF